MPEYLAPGVYVEETSFRSRSIEGVSTTTTAFIGPVRYGPVDMQPDIITSIGEFERIYGDGQMLDFEDGRMHNYLWHAARCFFEEGGRRLYIARTFTPLKQPPPNLAGDGRAFVRVPQSATGDADAVLVKARFPGVVGNARVSFRLVFGGNVLAAGDKRTGQDSGTLNGLVNHDTVIVFSPVPPLAPPQNPSASTLALRDSLRDLAKTDPAKARQLAGEAVAAARAAAAEPLAIAAAATHALQDLQAVIAAYQADQQATTAIVAAAQAASNAAQTALTAAKAARQAALDDQAALPPGASQAEQDAAAALVAAATTAATQAQAAADRATQALADAQAALTVIDNPPDDGLLQKAQKAAAAAQPTAAAAQAGADTAGAHAQEVAGTLAEFTGADGPSLAGRLYRAYRSDPSERWAFYDADDLKAFDESTLDPHPATGHKVCVATVAVTVQATPTTPPQSWSGLPLDRRHAVAGDADSLLNRLGERPGSLAAARTLPIAIIPGAHLLDAAGVPKISGVRLAALLFDTTPQVKNNDGFGTYPPPFYDTPSLPLAGGNDGTRPEPDAYQGSDVNIDKTGLKLLEDVEDVSIVAAPGVTWGMDQTGWRAKAQSINGMLLTHCENMRYRVAVLDSGNAQSVADVRSMRAKIDSARGHGALYYPWVRVLDPITRRELDLPPSGFVAGIYARNDIERAVYKAPANEVVRSAIGFEVLLNKAQQEVLNPEGINCFRFFEGRGYRLWGARTVSSDPEWKYVNLRRYFGYLERSIDKGTQWAVFEPNGEALWANVRRTIEDFLLNEWQNGALLGDKPEKAFFVRCDRSTMTQNDLDNGRLICLVGVAALKPAEFVIFRIGQWTADRKN